MTMFRERKVAVIIPAFNEELAIARTIDSVPAFVDHIIVVDDASEDDTVPRAQSRRAPRVDICRHPTNRGVGGAIVTGYHHALTLDVDIAVVMAGDGQMDPEDLEPLLRPIADNTADYTKGDRFRHPEIWRSMPTIRIVGNALLSMATKLTSGYLHVWDSQCGYTAITKEALQQIELERLFPRYGYPNDLLARLQTAGQRVVDVPVRPVYGPNWASGVTLTTAIYPITFVLARSWLRRQRDRLFPRKQTQADAINVGVDTSMITDERGRRSA